MQKWLIYLLALWLAAAGAAGAAGAEDKKEVQDTILAEIAAKGGTVHLVERGEIRRFDFKDEPVAEGTSLMDVHRVFRPKSGYEAILVQDFTGPLHCPVEFRFLVLYGDGRHMVTPLFGHCDSQPEFAVEGKTIAIRFESFGSLPGETWTFDGKTLAKTANAPRAD